MSGKCKMGTGSEGGGGKEEEELGFLEVPYFSGYKSTFYD